MDSEYLLVWVTMSGISGVQIGGDKYYLEWMNIINGHRISRHPCCAVEREKSGIISFYVAIQDISRIAPYFIIITKSDQDRTNW